MAEFVGRLSQTTLLLCCFLLFHAEKVTSGHTGPNCNDCNEVTPRLARGRGRHAVGASVAVKGAAAKTPKMRGRRDRGLTVKASH